MPEPRTSDSTEPNLSAQPANPYANGANPFLRKAEQAQPANTPWDAPAYPDDANVPGAPSTPVPPDMTDSPDASNASAAQPPLSGQVPQPPVEYDPQHAQERGLSTRPEEQHIPHQGTPQETGQPFANVPTSNVQPSNTQPDDGDQFGEAPIIPGFSKVVWFSSGFLLGFIGLLIIFLFNLRRPKHIRKQILLYACIGWLAGMVFSMMLLGMGGFGTGAGLMGTMPGTGSTGTSSGGIF